MGAAELVVHVMGRQVSEPWRVGGAVPGDGVLAQVERAVEGALTPFERAAQGCHSLSWSFRAEVNWQWPLVAGDASALRGWNTRR